MSTNREYDLTVCDNVEMALTVSFHVSSPVLGQSSRVAGGGDFSDFAEMSWKRSVDKIRAMI